jgi:PAS domain S-box-containing protein
MMESIRILVVDDDPEQVEMIRERLRIAGSFTVDHVGAVSELWPKLESGQFELLLLDYLLPDGTGFDILYGLQERRVQIPAIMITGQGDERVAAQAIQYGASDYLMKGSDYLLSLPALIQKAVRAYQLQQSAQQSIEQVRYQALLLNNVRDAVVVWDLKGHITYWNPAATVLFGWNPQERLGRQVEEVYLPAFSPPVRVPREGDTIGHHIERQYQKRNQQTIWVSSRISALRDVQAGNRLIGYMDVVHDITKRKEAEQSLRSERNFVSAILDTVGALIVVIDPQGRIVRFNRTAEQISGYSFSEVRGRYFWELFHQPEEAHSTVDLPNALQAGDFPQTHESSLINRDGERRLITWTNTVLTGRHGHIEYIIATGLDQTEQRQAEQALKDSQTHLVQAARLATIGEMASGVAHQINNPLTTIIADAQLLLRQLPAGFEGRTSAEAIEQAGWRLQEVVQRLLEFSQPVTTALEVLSLNQTIRHALSLVGAHIESIGIRLDVSLEEALPPVRGNTRQLEDLWVNLLLLARDAVKDGQDKQISIQTGADRSGWLYIKVRDRGQPIPQSQLASLFEPNFTGSTIGRGTGMELSICREIVRQHNGEISAVSAPDHDTIFTVLLPVDNFTDMHPVSQI